MERVSAPFDPVVVVTTDRLDAYVDDARRPMLNNYTRHAKIGDGHHGEVYLCYQLNPKLPHGHADRRIPVAMKSVKRDNPRAKQFRKLRQQRLPSSAHTPLVDRLGTTEAKIRKEIAIMKKCRHPHVVRLYEVIDDRSKEKIYMVMEYLAGGEVKWSNEHGQPILSYDQTRRIVRDAVLGLEYLHHQGIIHRDIKPANLLYTQDRCQVKIADFGVSHFSYAQRLAAAGAAEGDDPEDILLDDSDLTKRAGTPSFLAPEIVYEHTNDPSPGPSFDPATPGRPFSPHDPPIRPPITKSIDVWALGVTLYCLLFGKTPFTADPAAAGTEWSLYNSICNLDWAVEDTMCADRVPTGGRRPRDEHTPGATLVCLLDRLLRKDPKSRITLDQVKRHPWLLQDIAEPAQWLRLTLPKGKIDVSADETSDAMSVIRFQWNWNSVARRVSSLFRRTREHHSHAIANNNNNNNSNSNREASLAERDEEASQRGVVMSDPHAGMRAGLRRHQSVAARFSPNDDDELAHAYHGKRDKGKQKHRKPEHGHVHERLGGGGVGGEVGVRPKSTEPWPLAGRAGANASASRSTSAIPFRRRGSGSLLSAGAESVSTTDHHQYQQQRERHDAGGGNGSSNAHASAKKGRTGHSGASTSTSTSPTTTAATPTSTSTSTSTSPTTSRSTNTPIDNNHTRDRPRARFSNFFSVRHWRPNKFSPSASGSASGSASASASTATSRSPTTMPAAAPRMTTATTPATASVAAPVFSRTTTDGTITITRRSEEVLRHYQRHHGRGGGGSDTEADGHGHGQGDGTGTGKAKGKGKGKGTEGTITVERRAASWGQGDEPGAGVSGASYGFLRPGVAAGMYVPRTPSRLSMDLGAGQFSGRGGQGAVGDEEGQDQDQGDEDEKGQREGDNETSLSSASPNDKDGSGGGGGGELMRRRTSDRFGPAYFDEDSSTIASVGGEGRWLGENTSVRASVSDDEDDGELDFDEASGSEKGREEDVDDDDDDDSEQEHGVVFSPRKRLSHHVPADDA